MKTIEMYDAEITAKIDKCKDGLAVFEDNIGKIGQVIGKDSTVVHQTLSKSLSTIITDYSMLMPRNATTLQSITDRLDKVLAVLATVIDAIDAIDNSPQDEHLTLKNKVDTVMEGVNKYVDDMSKKLTVEIQQGTGKTVSSNVVKYSIFGVGTYLILNKLIGLSPFLSLVGAAGVVMIVDKANK